MKFFPISSFSATATTTATAYSAGGPIVRVCRDSTSVAVGWVSFSNDTAASSNRIVIGDERPRYFKISGFTKVWLETLSGTVDFNISFSPDMGGKFYRPQAYGLSGIANNGAKTLTPPSAGGDMVICRQRLFSSDRLFFSLDANASANSMEIIDDTVISGPFGASVSCYTPPAGTVSFSYGTRPK